MKVSLSWLQDYLSINLPVSKLSEKMTDLGLECTFESSGISFSDIVLGSIVSCKPHPNSDHLSICEVDIGENDLSTIVCGAPNVKSNIKVPVAKVGATLDNGNFKIKKTKLRGVTSSGMICSGKEINYNNNHEGILEIVSDYPLGSSIENVLKFEEETIFDIDLTPNRGDCFSHKGIAREISIFEGSNFKPKNVEISSIDNKIDDLINLKNIDKNGCPRYAARIIRNVKVGPSPEWLTKRLQSIGQKSVNNIVDAANYILMDTGHPMHTFDYDKINGKEINVRFANNDEKIVTLDNVERNLKDFHLLICDAKQPIALAGIMGGLNTSVSDSTTNILIECAYFEPTVIRRGSKYLDLSTDASKRFERDIDIDSTISSLNQLTSLIQSVADGQIPDGVIDFYPNHKKIKQIHFNLDKCNAFLGTSVSFSDTIGIFEKLFIKTETQSESILCTIPSFRNDIDREVDLFEEIARVLGYNNIPSSLNYHGSYTSFTDDERYIDDKMRQFVSSNGFHEHYSNSLNNIKDIEFSPDKLPVAISNPLNKEMSYLRNSLVPGLLKAISYNENRQKSYFKLYEVGAVHTQQVNSPTKTNESFNLGLAWYGKSLEHWNKKQVLDLFEVKSDLEKFFYHFNLNKIRFELTNKKHFNFYLHIFYRKIIIGFIAIPDDKMKKYYSIRGDLFVSQLNIDSIKDISETIKKTFTPPNQYPSIARDIAIQIDNDISAEAILRTIKSKGGNTLTKISLFDFYTGDELGENKKSLAFSLRFESLKKTLKDSEVDKIMKDISDELHNKHEAIQR